MNYKSTLLKLRDDIGKFSARVEKAYDKLDYTDDNDLLNITIDNIDKLNNKCNELMSDIDFILEKY